MECIMFIALVLISSTSYVTADNHYVIIVGAGPSGIAAATKLLESGVNNLTILEAENRIGGRVNSVKFGDAYVDLGAEFCHGEEDNIVYQMVKDYDILKHSQEAFELFYSYGSKVEEELAKEIYNFVNLYEKLDRNNSDYYVTIGDFFIEKYESEILQKYKNESMKLNICKDALLSLENSVCRLDGSFSWFKPVLNNHYEKCFGDLHLNWNGLGYMTVLDIMIKKYPHEDQSLKLDSKIHLNKTVEKIIWDKQADRVLVKCEDDTEYTSDYLIFTPSLGVVKKKHEDLFVPELSKGKSDCIKALGYDADMKIHLYFPEKWWSGKFIDKIFIWSKNDIDSLIEQFHFGPKQERKSWLTGLYYFSSAANNPNVLVAWATGPLIPDLENTPEEVIVDGIMFVLRKFLGSKYNITEPSQMIHSEWYQNPRFRGVYSYDTVDSLKLGYDCHGELATPLYDQGGKLKLLFAGEATNKIHYSTVHGAIESGYREAERILNLSSNKI